MNLFTIAASNGASFPERIEELRAELPEGERGALDRFTDRALRDGRVAINMRQSVLSSFLATATYQNVYDWAKARARRSTKTEDAILRERLGAFYDRRVAFDRAFEGGERFRYGALNIGGAGATSYGSFCAVIGERAPAELFDVAYLPGDSLKTYLHAACDDPGRAVVDADAIQRDAAPHVNRHHLAALKHGRGVCASPEPRWPSLLSSATDYIEALFVGDLRPSDLQCVRMARSDHDVYFAYAFEDFRAKLGEADRVLVESFVTILEQLEARGVALEVVDD